MITFSNKGNFEKTTKFLNYMKKRDARQILDKYGRKGVALLSQNTPVDSGKTASSWNYEIHSSKGVYSIVWTNSNVVNGVNIAVILQYGHGTRNGGYVQGRDYINPATAKVFDEMTEELWREVTSA